MIVVSSDKSRNIFPSNTSSSFSNQLASTLKLAEHEVGLIKLFYHDNYVSEEARRKARLKKPGHPFFDLEKNQNSIYVNEIVQTDIPINKTTEDFSAFIRDVNTALSQQLVNGEISVNLDSQGKPTQTTFVYRFDYGFRVYFGHLAEILGFENKEYPLGVHESSNPPNLTKFKALAHDYQFMVKKRKWKMTKVSLPQLEDPALDDICLQITKSCADRGYRIAAILDEEKALLTINTFSEDIYLSLSNYLNDYLKLPFRMVFNGLSTVAISVEAIDPFGSIVHDSSAEAAPAIPTTQILVQCGLSVTNYVATQPMQLLQIFPRQEGKRQFALEVLSPIYFPVTPSETSFVSILLLDEHLNPLPEQSKPTTAVLHFRKRLW